MRGGMTGQVNVDVQATKSQDLSLMLAEVRSEYEAAVEKNRRQAEAWYMKQVCYHANAGTTTGQH